MFTELLKRKRNLMLFAMIATLAVAALTTLASTRTTDQELGRSKNQKGQVTTGLYTQYNETTMRFIN